MKPHLTPINLWQPGRRYAFNPAQERDWHPDIIEPEFWEIAEQVWEYSCCGIATLYNFYTSIRHVISQGIEGDVIECGVFFGGTTMLGAETLKRFDTSPSRSLIAMDTFTGFIRKHSELDLDYTGTEVIVTVDDPNADGFYKVSSDNMRSIGFDRLKIIKGDVLETVPALMVDKISILRLDTDTFDTTKLELDHLYDRVSVGGVVIIDDYGFTVGCKKAVDDFAVGKKIFPIRVDRFCRAWVKVSN
jgi:hypothetical protein